jgi:hypothetical protein
MRKILFEGIAQGSLTERSPVPDEAALGELAKSVNKESHVRLGVRCQFARLMPAPATDVSWKFTP